MCYDINPYRALISGISSTEFEVFCMETIKAYAAKENLPNFSIKHNQKIEADDGTYQIDVIAEYTALSVKNVVIIECKMFSSPVERDYVVALCGKVASIGANKGILISTAGFQSGAVKYAEKHGIALLQIIDQSVKHIVNYMTTITSKDYFQRALEDMTSPRFIAKEWDCLNDYPYDDIYSM